MGIIFPALRRLWRVVGSTQLAAILIAALLVATLLTSLFPHMPDNPSARGPWLSAVTMRYGHTTALLHTLGLFNTYHAPWYLVLLAALVVNSLACTAQRLPRLWRSLSKPPTVTQPERFYHGFAQRSQWPVPSLQAGVDAAKKVLSGHRYRPVLEGNEQACSANLYAERGRWRQLGTPITHVAGLILVIAVAARPAVGWQQANIVLLPGQAHILDLKSPLTVQTGTLVMTHHPGGEPQNYQVPLAVLSDGSPLVSHTVQINHPFTYRGVSFHLQGYGRATHVVTPGNALNLAFVDNQAEEITLPEAGIALRVAHQPQDDTLFVEARSADGSVLGSGSVLDGQQIQVQGTPVTFTLGHYTVWQVSHDPTFALALGAAGFMFAGLLVSLGTSYRRIWLRLDAHQAQMVGAGDFAGEFETLAGEIASATDVSELPATPVAREGDDDGR